MDNKEEINVDLEKKLLNASPRRNTIKDFGKGEGGSKGDTKAVVKKYGSKNEMILFL